MSFYETKTIQIKQGNEAIQKKKEYDNETHMHTCLGHINMHAEGKKTFTDLCRMMREKIPADMSNLYVVKHANIPHTHTHRRTKSYVTDSAGALSTMDNW